MRKRIISIVLVLMMIFTLLPITALAEDDPLTAVTGVKLEGDVLSWNEFPEADSYDVYVGNFLNRTGDISFNLNEWLSEKDYVGTGNYRVTVYANKNGKRISSKSNEVTYQYTMVSTGELHTITVLPNENGSATVDKTEAVRGDMITITPNPESGYRFKKCKIIYNDTYKLDDNTFYMPDYDVQIELVFVEEKPIIQNVKLDGDILSWDAFEGADEYEVYGSRFAIKTTETSFNLRECIAEDPSFGTGKYYINVHAMKNGAYISDTEIATTVTYDYVMESSGIAHNITLLPNENGSATVDKTTAKKGELVTVTPDPKSGYRLKDFAVHYDGNSYYSMAGNFYMPDCDVEIELFFVEDKPIVENVKLVGDTLSWDAFPEADEYEVHGGRFDEKTTDTSIDLYDLCTNRNMESGTYIFRVNARKNGETISDPTRPTAVDYNYTLKSFSVTVESDENGTATADKTTALTRETVTLTATPKSGYLFKEWEVISGNITINSDNTFVMKSKDVQVKAIFWEHVHITTFVPGYTSGCKDAGKKSYYYCSSCGKSFKDAACTEEITDLNTLIIPPAGHNSWGNIAHKDATCATTGVVGGNYCTNCSNGKATAEQTIAAIGHNSSGTIAHKDATCTAAGIVGGKYCTRCNEGKAAAEKSIAALGHSWDAGAVKTAATALTAGEKVYTCSRCKATRSEVIPKTTAKGWQQINGTWYYFNTDGTLAKNEWIDGYWINADGSWTYQPRGSWKQDSTGWWYGDTSGWYAANGSQKIDGVVYNFNASGYWVEGSSGKSSWQHEGGNWYYYSNGNKATGWLNDGGTWYYMNSSGVMQTGWISSGGTWYYLKASGAMAANEWCDGYWLNGDGSWTYQYRGSWKQDSTGWWYGDTSGWYAANGTQKIDDVVYTFDARGYWVR